MKVMKSGLVCLLVLLSLSVIASVAFAVDSDGDGVDDLVDPNPSIVNANFSWAGIYTDSRQNGTQTTNIDVGIRGFDADFSNLTVSVSGPNGFSYTFVNADIYGTGSTLQAFKSYASLEEGHYEITVSDSVGGFVSRFDLHADPVVLPTVDPATIQVQRMASSMAPADRNSDVYRFTWAPLPLDDRPYYYRFRLYDQTTGSLVYSSPREQNVYEDIPASALVEGASYSFRVEAHDAPNYVQLFNRSRTDNIMNFVPAVSDYNSLQITLSAPGVVYRTNSDGSHVVEAWVGASTSAGVTLAELIDPVGTPYSLTYSGGAYAMDFDPASMPAGLYTFHVVANGIDHYAYDTLPANPNWLPVLANAGNWLENYGDGNVSFRWSDVDSSEILYSRLRVRNTVTGARYSSSRVQAQFMSVPESTLDGILGTTDPREWWIHLYDSSDWTTATRSSIGQAKAFSLPAYDPDAIRIFGRPAHRYFTNGQRDQLWFQNNYSPGTLTSVHVDGPSGYSRDLLAEGNFYIGLNEVGYYLYDTPLNPGLYTFTATDSTARTAVFHNALPTIGPIPLPVVDHASINVSELADGQYELSWAPVRTDFPGWYSVRFYTLEDLDGDGHVDEAATFYNLESTTLTLDPSSLPGGPYCFDIIFRDGANGATSNHRSMSIFLGTEDPGFDYATLTDADNDRWASNVDPDDNDPLVTPLSLPASVLQVVSPNGGEVLEAGSMVDLTWDAQTGADHYAVRLSINGGASFWTLATNVTGNSYSWTVDNVSTDNAVVRVVAYDASNGWLASDDSDAPFGIVKYGSLLTPNGGEMYSGGETVLVDWADHPQAVSYKVRISIDGGGKFWTLQDGITESQANVTLPNLASDQVLLKVVSYGAGNAWLAADDSDAAFSVVKGGTVLTPNGGGYYYTGDSLNISWAPHPDADHYVVRYSIDGGASYWTLPGGSNVTGTSFSWTLPNWMNSSDCMVLIQTWNGVGAWIAADKSDATFIVLPAGSPPPGGGGDPGGGPGI